jgi:hypothetical protein
MTLGDSLASQLVPVKLADTQCLHGLPFGYRDKPVSRPLGGTRD